MKTFLVQASVFLILESALWSQETEGLPKPELFKLSAEAISKQPAISDVESVGPQKMSAEAVAVWKFLAMNAEQYRLSPDVSNVTLVSEKASLLGKSYYFQQTLGGIDVNQATLVVTTNKQGKVTKVHTSMIPVTVDKVARVAKAEINTEKAFDVAWKTLGAQPAEKTGLYSEPTAELTYIATLTGFRLAYAVDLHCERKISGVENVPANEPALWRVMVDAVTGDPIGEPLKRSTDHKGEEVQYEKQAGDRSAAFRQYFDTKSQNALEAAGVEAGMVVQGKARVFDPDPMTTLMDSTLRDNSPSTAFDMAYFLVNLPEITKRDGKFFLEGPWIKLDDFESPFVKPSSTTNGFWDFKRGNVAFNDAMTYFHIDRSQRYIQSLGFTNIQHGPIGVDANGLNGADNSHFVPSTNTLAFGHGCIDDNEDADVILHEYGHAITHSINPFWSGGDSGAIGEGFGDYWAETSSLTSANGSTFQPFRTFDWDAAGCWPGRRLDVKPSEATYDPSRTYSDHEPIASNVSSDELWSTPLYQAHIRLRDKGVPRQEIDQIVLQSMFGIGSGFTMRTLAENVVDTADTLFPMGEHGKIFKEEFQKLKILP